MRQRRRGYAPTPPRRVDWVAEVRHWVCGREWSEHRRPSLRRDTVSVIPSPMSAFTPNSVDPNGAMHCRTGGADAPDRVRQRSFGSRKRLPRVGSAMRSTSRICPC